MQDILLVIDMQNDFIDGVLGTQEALEIVPRVREKIMNFDGKVFFTRDSHDENYLNTQEGKKLPIKHCIIGTDGWEIRKEIDELRKTKPIDKKSFGSAELGAFLKSLDEEEKIKSITFVGLCTDICVISNAIITKAFLPEAEVIVDESCCAGVSRASHKNALEAMRVCQITIE